MAIGTLIDRFHVTTPILITSLGASLAAFLFWGFAQSLPLLLVFSILYGLTAGSFSTNFAGIIKEVQKTHAGADTGIVFGALGTGRGIGAVVSGPLSEALLSSRSAVSGSKFLYGSQYGGLVVFTGATAAVSASAFLWHRLGWL